MVTGWPITDESADLASLGSFIRLRRRDLSLTQTELAERLGWVQERISLLEHGKYGLPSLPSLARLAVAVECALTTLLAAAGFPETVEESERDAHSDGPTSAALLYTLEQLLAIDEVEFRPVLTAASSMIADVMTADKVDAFIYDAEAECLVAAGTSDTPMGRKQHELGLDRVSTTVPSRESEVQESGTSYMTGHAEEDEAMNAGFVQGLGVRSIMLVALRIAGERRGILVAASSSVDKFSVSDLAFFETVARWIGIVAHRAELLDATAA